MLRAEQLWIASRAQSWYSLPFAFIILLKRMVIPVAFFLWEQVGPSKHSSIHSRMWCVSDDSDIGWHSLGLYETRSQPMKQASWKLLMLDEPQVLTESRKFRFHWSFWCWQVVKWLSEMKHEHIFINFGVQMCLGERSNWLDFDAGPNLTFLPFDQSLLNALVQFCTLQGLSSFQSYNIIKRSDVKKNIYI